jgi:uncharacterized membrane protein
VSFSTSITINAPAQRVWEVLTDVERWPESTASMTRVQRLDNGPFRIGSGAKIEQPKLPTMTWTVTDLQPGRSFSWSTGSAGVTTVADHRVEPVTADSTTVTLSVHEKGPLAPLVQLLYGGITRRYVTMEAEGLKRVVEAGASLSAA